MSEERDQYDSISPIDYRYWNKEVAQYLSEAAFVQYKLKVEIALVQEFAARDLCQMAAVEEVKNACQEITCQEVYAEEDRVKHDIRALVNCIQRRVSSEVRPFVHMTATSYDIIETANALRFRDAISLVFVPKLKKLLSVLIGITRREADTLQVGRTHGQHAVPITFGFAVASYVSRLGDHIKHLERAKEELRGKFSGAVGGYNASSLIFRDPEDFEASLLRRLGLKPAEHSTQIVPPEAVARLLSEVVTGAGIMANLARDMRSLQRSEIAEVGEGFAAGQVGSSTMPQKRNPINFENVESLWKVIVGRMVTVHLDQVSEHQRDLTGSASARTYGEIIAYAVEMTVRLERTMSKLAVNHENLVRNLALGQGSIAAEPLYIILASLGHPDAHEHVLTLTREAERSCLPLAEVVQEDVSLAPYIARMSPAQQDIIRDPLLYTGIAAEKARSIANQWDPEK